MIETSAGTILYTIIDNQIYFLLSLDFHSNWGFPKGHLEENETCIQAAIRETKEEVGIDVIIDDKFKEEIIYKLPNGNEKHAIYFIGKYLNQTPVKQIEEVQDIKILPFEEAFNLLTFDSMKEILLKAKNYLQDQCSFQ